MTEDNRLYRCSASDKIALCAHFEGSEQETDATRYGNKIHSWIAYCLKNPSKTNRMWLAANGASDEEAALVLRACDTAIAEIPDIRGVEDPVHIYDVTEEEITWGTCDVWGYRNDQLTLLDWKTGEDHGYDRQMNHYALGLMDREKQDSCDVVIIYFKKNKPDRLNVLYQQGAEVVNETYEAVIDKDNRPYQINDYCGWCNLKKNGCLAWLKEQVIATAPSEAPQILRESLQAVLADPDKRDRFVVAFRALTSLYEDMGFEEAARTDLAGGRKSPYLSMYERKGKDKIDSEQFLQIVVPQMGTMRASTCVAVFATKAKEAWEKFSQDPFPVPVVPGPSVKVLKEVRNKIE